MLKQEDEMPKQKSHQAEARKWPLVFEYANLWQKSSQTLLVTFFSFFMVWVALTTIWTTNTWTQRRWQTSRLQWCLTTVPIMKLFVLGLSCMFWYSCLNLNSCSFWVAFGVFVSRIFLEVACFTTFLLISHGYCIMHEQLSLSERRSLAALMSISYITLTGHKASISFSAVLVTALYILIFYVIFSFTSFNLLLLKEQLQFARSEGLRMMEEVVSIKRAMFKKFEAAVMIVIASEVMIYCRADGIKNEFWIQLMFREFMETGVFSFIGWTFRSRKMAPLFTVIPPLHSSAQRRLPPIYRFEMGALDFKNLKCKDWRIGVPTSIITGGNNNATQGTLPVLVMVQNPEAPSSSNPGIHHHSSTAACLEKQRNSNNET